jgi:hypothetical protein
MAKAWIGIAVAIGINFLLDYMPLTFGTLGYILPLVLILVMIFCLITDRLRIILNYATAIFLTVFTAMSSIYSFFITQTMTAMKAPAAMISAKVFTSTMGLNILYLGDLALGIVAFLIIPFVIMKIITMRTVKQNTIVK